MHFTSNQVDNTLETKLQQLRQVHRLLEQECLHAAVSSAAILSASASLVDKSSRSRYEC